MYSTFLLPLHITYCRSRQNLHQKKKAALNRLYFDDDDEEEEEVMLMETPPIPAAAAAAVESLHSRHQHNTVYSMSDTNV